jgi:hypothetical protein
MRDHIRIHPRQLTEMKRLIRLRVAQPNGSAVACRPDTAAKVSSGGLAILSPYLLQGLLWMQGFAFQAARRSRMVSKEY